MKYQYTYRNKASELWQLSMYHIYGSMVGVCNLVFTVAMIALSVSRWETTTTTYRILMILGCCLFPLLQPCFIYLKAKKQAAGITEDTWIGFSDQGLHIQQAGKTSDIPWSSIKRISRKPTIIIIFSDTTHGFVLTNRVLGTQREEFYSYITSKIHK